MASDPTRLFRGQGVLYLAQRNELGRPMGLIDIGNCTELMLRPSVERIEHRESRTGRNALDAVIERTLNVEVSMVLESAAASSLVRYVYGTATDKAAATVTDEEVIGYQGASAKLANINLTSFTSLTNADGSVTYVEGTDYVVNLRSGVIKFASGATFTDGDSLRANYAAGEYEKISAFTNPNRYFYLLFEGLNSAEEDAPVVVEVYKIRFDPSEELPMINEEFASYSLGGNALIDSSRPADKENGQFFTVSQLKSPLAA